jgi:hypothetical protein
VQYEIIEATLQAWRAKRLLKTVVSGNLASHQMFRFYNEFKITDTTTCSDLSYDRAESILQAMKEENMQIQMDTMAPISSTANPILNAGFDDAPVPALAGPSRPKNGKRGASASTQELAGIPRLLCL